MAQTLLITEDYVYQNTQINDSVEAAKIYPYIRLAQDKWIEPFTGTELLNKIKADAAAGTIAGNYLILLDEYLRPLLVWRTCHELLPNINYKIDNGAIAQHNSDNTTSVGMSEMNRLIEDAKNNATYYEKRLHDYLCNNSALFPEYSTNTGADLSPRSHLGLNFDFSGNNTAMGRRQTRLNRYLP
jgi:hypothetical protein